LLDEIFNYTVGDLNGQSSWITAGSYVGGTGYTINASNLSYSDGSYSSILSGTGKSLLHNVGTSAVDYKGYKPFYGGNAISSGALYLSFLLKVNANISSTNQEVFGLADVLNAGPKVLIGKTTTGFFKIGTVRASSSSADYKYAVLPTSLTVGNTYLIVLKYDFSTLVSSVYINPALGGTEAAATVEIVDNASTTTRTKLSNLWLRAQGTVVTNSSIGGARVTTSWAEAVEKNLATPIVNSKLDLSIKTDLKAIVTNESGHIQLYNLQGQQVLDAETEGRLNTNLQSGFYLIKFTNKLGKQVNQKIVIR
jgi:hypothetical protein